jgi:hypothetical protein
LRYVAEVIVLDRRPVIRIRSVTAHGRFLVGSFASVESINDHGGPIDLADLRIERQKVGVEWPWHGLGLHTPVPRRGPGRGRRKAQSRDRVGVMAAMG